MCLSRIGSVHRATAPKPTNKTRFGNAIIPLFLPAVVTEAKQATTRKSDATAQRYPAAPLRPTSDKRQASNPLLE